MFFWRHNMSSFTTYERTVTRSHGRTTFSDNFAGAPLKDGGIFATYYAGIPQPFCGIPPLRRSSAVAYILLRNFCVYPSLRLSHAWPLHVSLRDFCQFVQVFLKRALYLAWHDHEIRWQFGLAQGRTQVAQFRCSTKRTTFSPPRLKTTCIARL